MLRCRTLLLEAVLKVCFAASIAAVVVHGLLEEDSAQRLQCSCGCLGVIGQSVNCAVCMLHFTQLRGSRSPKVQCHPGHLQTG